MKETIKNLNEIRLLKDLGNNTTDFVVPLSNNNIRSDSFSGSVEVVFRDLECRLVELIREHSDCHVFGCVAWLTSPRILTALKKCRSVQIVVQKEDFLRPDSDNQNNYTNKLRDMYQSLPTMESRFDMKYGVDRLSTMCKWGVEPVMCAGNYNEVKSPAFPRMHNKFITFCRPTFDDSLYKGVAVWTGSFNFTNNATNSLENALILQANEGDQIIESYVKEHHQIYSISELLDWEHKWVCPEYRIGS